MNIEKTVTINVTTEEGLDPDQYRSECAKVIEHIESGLDVWAEVQNMYVAKRFTYPVVVHVTVR